MPTINQTTGNSHIGIVGSSMGTALQEVLLCDDIQPGSQPSYEACKAIFEYHTLGSKMVEKPVKIAMSQKREIAVPIAPGDIAVKAFEVEWKKMRANDAIFRTRILSKIYDISSLTIMIDDKKNNEPINFENI